MVVPTARCEREAPAMTTVTEPATDTTPGLETR